MSPFDFICAGETLQALPAGALYWPARRLLAVADLHFEKGSSYAVNALKLLPRHDTRQTLSVLASLIETLRPERVVCLGDSFHDRDVTRHAIARTVEVDDVDPRGTGIEELSRLGDGVLVVDGHALVVALGKAHSAPS